MHAKKWTFSDIEQNVKRYFFANIYRPLSLNPIKFLKLRAHSVHTVQLDSAWAQTHCSREEFCKERVTIVRAPALVCLGLFTFLALTDSAHHIIVYFLSEGFWLRK